MALNYQVVVVHSYGDINIKIVLKFSVGRSEINYWLVRNVVLIFQDRRFLATKTGRFYLFNLFYLFGSKCTCFKIRTCTTRVNKYRTVRFQFLRSNLGVHMQKGRVDICGLRVIWIWCWMSFIIEAIELCLLFKNLIIFILWLLIIDSYSHLALPITSNIAFFFNINFTAIHHFALYFTSYIAFDFALHFTLYLVLYFTLFNFHLDHLAFILHLTSTLIIKIILHFLQLAFMFVLDIAFPHFILYLISGIFIRTALTFGRNFIL